MSARRSNARRYKSIAPKLEQALAVVAVLAFAIVAIVFVWRTKYNLDFFPINGVFQTFNPSRRICNGETPGADFNPYLGLGTTYVVAFITYVFGCNLSASQESIHLTHVVCHWLAFLVLFKLIGASVKNSVTFSSAIVTLLLMVTFEPFALSFINIPYPVDYNVFYSWRELLTPTNSSLGLRSTLPFITSLTILVGLHILTRKQRLLPYFFGILTGIQLLWSNDYGVPSTLALLAVAAIYLLKSEKSNVLRSALKLTVMVVTTMISFVVQGSLLTQGNLLNWIRENFSGVASDQFWYFGLRGGKIIELSDLFNYLFHPFFLIYIASLAIIILVVILDKDKFNSNYLLLFYVGATVFGAGTLASIGGTFGWRYYSSTIMTSYFIVPVAIFLLIDRTGVSNYCQSFSTRLRRYYRTISYINNVAHRFVIVSILTILIGAALSVVIVHRPSTHPYNNDSFFYVKPLGGWLSRQFKPAFQVAEQIRDETQLLPDTRRMLSTYASMMDVVAGSKNVTGVDYIIHALGDRARQNYLDRWRAAPPEYITTIREDFTDWESWIRRSNWWFYRSFARGYKPVVATPYNIVWKRASIPTVYDTSTADCVIRKELNNAVELSVAIKNRLDSRSLNEVYVVDLALSYHLDVTPFGIPFFGKRGLVNAIEIKTPSLKPIASTSNQSYGLPPHHQDWHVPVEVRLGIDSTLKLVGYPETRSTLVIERCSAQLFAPASAFSVTKALQPANISNSVWEKGISVASGEKAASFPSFMANEAAVSTIYPGDTITFAGSNRRRVVAVEGGRVWVTGPELDPLNDGYPHSIAITQK